MNENLKSELNELIEMFSKAEGAPVRRALSSEVKRFVSYIMSADSTISDEEPEFISELLDREISGEELSNYIAAENLRGNEFATAIPPLYRKYIHNIDLVRKYLQVFSLIGNETIICDKNADVAEVDSFKNYITMLCNFAVDENPGSSFIQNDGHIVAMELHVDNGEEEETLESLLDELDKLIGLSSVKKNVHSLIHLQSIQMEREKRGLAKIPMSNHLVFTGNPGTGKTTVARLIARIYNKIGLLSTGSFVEVDRSGMVAGYVGQTAIEVKNVMDSAKGGVLFIDEAYSLANGLRGDYGMEAIETLLKRMEDDRENMVVIVAGYPKLMERFISSNPGLRSRFSKKIYFPDYNPDELLEILQYMVKQHSFTISEDALDYAYERFEKMYINRGEDFANAREVRNFFESAVVSQADRLFGIEDLTDEELCRLEAADFKYNEIMMG